MQKPPWCPWKSTAKSDLDSFDSILQQLSLKAHLRERLDEDEAYRGKSTGCTYDSHYIFMDSSFLLQSREVRCISATF